LSYEQRLETNELAWREKCAPSWDAVVIGLRENHPRWTAAEIVRAEGTGHDDLTEGGPEVVHVFGNWLKANDS
jgi:hypothetical protein